jgi:hypothetical protein
MQSTCFKMYSASFTALESTLGEAGAIETVKQVIGNAVANGVIDKFNVLGYGIEGGFSACAEANSRSRGFPAFVKQLRTISPNKNTTAYSLNVVATCTADN